MLTMASGSGRSTGTATRSPRRSAAAASSGTAGAADTKRINHAVKLSQTVAELQDLKKKAS